MAQKRQIRAVAQIFFSPEALVPFFVGSVFLAVVGNAVFELLKKLIGEGPGSLALILVLATLVFLFAVVAFYWVLKRKTRPIEASFGKPPSKHRGLVVLVSRQEPAARAIAFHQEKLRWVQPICSLKSYSEAKALQKEFEGRDFSVQEPLVVNNVFDVSEAKEVVERALNALPADISAEEVICDLTGMPAQCSLGMFLACIPRGIALQYTPAVTDEQGNIVRSADPIEIRIQ